MLDVREVTGSSPVSSTKQKPRNFNSYGAFLRVPFLPNTLRRVQFRGAEPSFRAPSV